MQARLCAAGEYTIWHKVSTLEAKFCTPSDPAMPFLGQLLTVRSMGQGCASVTDLLSHSLGSAQQSGCWITPFWGISPFQFGEVLSGSTWSPTPGTGLMISPGWAGDLKKPDHNLRWDLLTRRPSSAGSQRSILVTHLSRFLYCMCNFFRTGFVNPSF